MPFLFSFVCDLFASLEDIVTRDPPHLPAKSQELCRRTVTQWFRNHRYRIDANDTDGVAFLSALFPERRTDRVYNLREASLVKVLARSLGLGWERQQQLDRWRRTNSGDLGECVERVMKQAENTPPQPGNEVTVEEVDTVLAGIAARSRFSSAKVRSEILESAAYLTDTLLNPVIRRMQSRDAKWLTRMILKDYTPVVLPEALVSRSFHFLLPDLLKVFSAFDAVIPVLRGPVIGGWPSQPDRSVEDALRDSAVKHLVPRLGVKVGRATFLKARSIKHCLKMAGARSMSLEKKYDGEYCQIHVDVTKGEDWIQIFSKSGKDSTKDRKAIHDTIRECLGIGTNDCKITRRCILEGELVVYSDKDKKILEFHKLRKHLPRSGVHLGTEQDSQPHEYEHLMIIFYDLLLLDDDNTLAKSYSDRRGLMKETVTRIPGRAEFVMREEIDFSRPSGAERLRHCFAYGIIHRWEGFVLKPCLDPYFSFDRGSNGNYPGCWIKLKKDYIQGLGDTSDFAVVGASYNAKEAQKFGVKHASWTTFHIACMENKEQVTRSGAKPMFRVVDALNQSISKHDMKTLNQLGIFQAVKHDCEAANAAFDIRAEPHAHCKMDVVFREPFVFEISGFGFDKNPNTSYFVPRFPRVNKIHWDRDFKDTISFAELQQMADEARAAPTEEQASQEEAEWVEKLKRADLSSAERKELSQSLPLPPLDVSQPTEASKRQHTKTSLGNTKEPSLVRVDNLELLGHQPRSAASAVGICTDSVGSLLTPPGSSAPEAGNDSQIRASPMRPKTIASNRSSKREAAEALDTIFTAPPAKKQNTNESTRPSTSSSFSTRQPSLKPISTAIAKSLSKPLADVTNTSPTCVRRTPAIAMEGTYKGLTDPLYPATKTATEQDGQRLTSTTKSAKEPMHQSNNNTTDDIPTSEIPSSPLISPIEYTHNSSQTAFLSTAPPTHTPPTLQTSPTTNIRTAFKLNHSRCAPTPSSCLLTNVTFLLSPYVAPMPYVTKNLLPKHNVTHVVDVTLWHPSRGAVAGIHGKRKIVLVESRAATATASVVRNILDAQIEERVLFFDWRLLEEGCEGGEEEKGDKWAKRYYVACVEAVGDRGGRFEMVGKEGLEDGRWRF